MTDSVSPLPEARKPRRTSAVVVAIFLSPVTGYVTIGRWRRALVGMAIYLAAYGAIITAIAMGAGLRASLIMMALLFALYWAAVVDVARLDRRDPLPSWGKVAGFYVLVSIASTIVSAQVKAHVLEAFSMPSGSMIPSIDIGDHFFVSKLPRSVTRGEVVAFRYPPEPQTRYVKRVIAIGGDTAEGRDGRILVNGTPLAVSLIQPANPGTNHEVWQESSGDRSYEILRVQAIPPSWSPTTVPPGHVFLLGDNRDNSNDSRVWGPAPETAIEGHVRFIFWSSGPDGIHWDRIGRVIQ
jgi:signal peptidase I